MPKQTTIKKPSGQRRNSRSTRSKSTETKLIKSIPQKTIGQLDEKKDITPAIGSHPFGSNTKNHAFKASEYFILLTYFIANKEKDSWMVDLLRHLLPRDTWVRDGGGNLRISIPLESGDPSKTLFMAHMDTVSTKPVLVNRIQWTTYGNAVQQTNPQILVATDGKSILGADDRAGCAILCSLIQKGLPGTYVFFHGEERGRIGSNWVIDKDKENYVSFDRAIAFDRFGYTSVITRQTGTETCSTEFADALIEALNKGHKLLEYKKDTRGSVTDSYTLRGLIPECTNLSVGYFDHHDFKESQNITFLDWLTESCMQVDWENLPVKREAKTYSYTQHHHGHRNIKSFDEREKDKLKDKTQTLIDHGSDDDVVEYYEELAEEMFAKVVSRWYYQKKLVEVLKDWGMLDAILEELLDED